MYNAFKKWVEEGCSRNVSFKYYSRMFMFYGPVLEMFDISTAYVLGKAREACFIMQMPICAQLNFTKYFTETFIHVINFMGKWPLAFRRLIQRSCAVNLSGWLCDRIRCICGGRNSPTTESLCIWYVYISLFACCSRLFCTVAHSGNRDLYLATAI